LDCEVCSYWGTPRGNAGSESADGDEACTIISAESVEIIACPVKFVSMRSATDLTGVSVCACPVKYEVYFSGVGLWLNKIDNFCQKINNICKRMAFILAAKLEYFLGFL